MATFSPHEQRLLALLCETFVPSIPVEAMNGLHPEAASLYAASAADLHLDIALAQALDRLMDDRDRLGMRVFLNLIDQSWFNRFTAGIAKPFTVMTPDEREALLRAWAHSDHALARQLFQSLKRLSLFLFYSLLPADAPNPTWAALGYAEPPRPPQSPRPIIPLTIERSTTLSTDVVVIGSGAGGGVVAGELAAAGLDVIVVEKGTYFHESDFHGRELASMETMYEKYGSLTTADKGIIVLAGSVLGGGTTINWGASFEPPAAVREEWAHVYGFTGANSTDFTQSIAAVQARLCVNMETPINAQNRVLAAGAEALGYPVSVIPRNATGCQDCGFCNFGCAYGAKQSTVKTYLQDAYNHGARILVRAEVKRVLIERGAAVGALATVQGEDGQPHEVTIRAKAVVAAAGAIHTPALLLRSGLSNVNIGANLHLHPTTVVFGLFEQPICGWRGSAMGHVVTQFADLDGRGYGVRLETAPVHPGIAALTIPWERGAQHKRLMAALANLANIIIITRDRGSGRITTDKRGRPIVHYRVNEYDIGHLERGVIEALRMHEAAGAYLLSSPHARHTTYRRGEDFDAFLQTVRARGWQPNNFVLFSAHQMSSCRIGGDTARGALNPLGESYEARQLFVADGSAMPSATGVNPMISIMATAHYIAQGIKARLA
ncbi:MAG: GMC family oxidoreductase [Aggregatilineales bacterium]